MNKFTESVFATDDEKEALSVCGKLERAHISCETKVNNSNYTFGPGILNSGSSLPNTRFEVLVAPSQVDRALVLLSGGELDSN